MQGNKQLIEKWLKEDKVNIKRRKQSIFSHLMKAVKTNFYEKIFISKFSKKTLHEKSFKNKSNTINASSFEFYLKYFEH